MEAKVDQTPATNSNPVLSIDKEGCVLYSNEAGNLLLNEWGVKVGEKLPSHIGNIIQRVISLNSPEKMEIKVGNRIYLVVFSPLPEQECVNISGFGTSDQKELEEKLHLLNEDLDAKSRELCEVDEALRKSESKYWHFLENAQEGIWIIDRSDRTIYVNKKISEMLGYNFDEIIGQSPQKFLAPEFLAVADNRLRENRQRVNQPIDYQFIRKDRSELWCIVSTHQLFDDEGKYSGSLGMLIDISKRKKAEAQLKNTLDNLDKLVKERTAKLERAYISLKESEKRLAEAQKITHIGNWERNLVTGDLYWSNEMYSIFGRNPQEGAPDYNVLLNYMHPEDRDYMDKTIKRALNGESYSTDHRIILNDGEERVVHVQAEVVFDEKNIPVRIIGTVQDITERKRTEYICGAIEYINQIIHSTLDFDEIMKKALSEASKVINCETSVISLKKGDHWIISYVHGFPEDVIGIEMNDKEEPHAVLAIKTKMPVAINDAFNDERVNHNHMRKWGVRSVLVVPLITRDDVIGVIFFNFHKSVFPFDDTHVNFGTQLASTISLALENSCLFENLKMELTERKKAEEILANIETARKKEIHHRIKNNLQVISSLLDLQAEQFKDREDIRDSEVLEAFKESQDRVISMALIHEELYKGGGFETLNFSLYIQELAKNLFKTYSLGNTDFTLRMDLEENAFFDMDTAVPLGMIVNELVSNSLKHAFIGRDEGEVRIKLHREEPTELENEDYESTSTNFTLTISDNGVGIPENLDIENLDSLGMQLVISLVDQVDGELELKRDNGTEFTIRFTVTEKKE